VIKLDSIEEDEFVEKSMELFEFINKKQYSLKEIGIAGKTIFDWDKWGILIDDKPVTGRRKYNVIEFVWIRLVVELRKFGLSMDAIRKVKDFLMAELKITNMLDMLVSGELEDTGEELGIKNKEGTDKLLELTKGVELEGEDRKDFQQFMDSDEYKLTQTAMGYLVFGGLLFRVNYQFLITAEGEMLISDGGDLLEGGVDADLLGAPYITFPLSLVLARFFIEDNLLLEEDKERFEFLSKEEKDVLELLRSGKITSLSIRLNKDKEISIVEAKEELDLERVSGRLMDLIMRNSFQTITYKTQNGKATHIERTTKYKYD